MVVTVCNLIVFSYGLLWSAVSVNDFFFFFWLFPTSPGVGKESADIWLYCINVRGCGKEDKREECLCREK